MFLIFRKHNQQKKNEMKFHIKSASSYTYIRRVMYIMFTHMTAGNDRDLATNWKKIL